MPIPLGIFAVAGAGAAAAGAYEQIATQILTTTATGIAFSSIPSTYKHLQIRVAARSNDASGDELIFIQMNGDTGSNYAVHGIFANGSTIGSFGSVSQARGRMFSIGNAVESSNIFGAGTTDILDYSSATKNKTIRSLGGFPGTNSSIRLNSSVWLNTTTVTSLFLFLESGQSFIAGSRFSLYGIKG